MFYEKEDIICLGLQSGSILIIQLLVEKTTVPQEKITQSLINIEYKNFSAREKTIAKAQFLCAEVNSDEK